MQSVPVRAAGAAIRFTVRKSIDTTWFEVEPRKMTLQSGESLMLNVQVKLELMKKIYYRGTFFLRSADGWLLPVSVTAKTDYTAKGFSGSECHEFILGKPFFARSDGEVFGLEYNHYTGEGHLL